MSKWPMRGHFRYLRFKTFPMTQRTPQCEVFWALLSNSKHSRVSEDSKSPTLEVLGFTPHTWPKWGCDKSTQWFVNRGFNNPWEPVIKIILETPKMTLCNFKQASLVAIGFKEQNFKTIDQSLDDMADLETMRCIW
jgi:hypothetical protein